jgi:SAM-dependent methyltransferase
LGYVITCDYIPVPEQAMEELLRLARIKKGELIYDLGCGTGELLITAAEKYGARGVGIEVSRRLAGWAGKEVGKRGLGDKINIICDNFFFPRFWAHMEGKGDKSYAIRNADVVYIYLTLQVQEALKPLLEKELRPGARVISYAFRLQDWKPVKEGLIEETPAYIFVKGKSF